MDNCLIFGSPYGVLETVKQDGGLISLGTYACAYSSSFSLGIGISISTSARKTKTFESLARFFFIFLKLNTSSKIFMSNERLLFSFSNGHGNKISLSIRMENVTF